MFELDADRLRVEILNRLIAYIREEIITKWNGDGQAELTVYLGHFNGASPGEYLRNEIVRIMGESGWVLEFGDDPYRPTVRRGTTRSEFFKNLEGVIP